MRLFPRIVGLPTQFLRPRMNAWLWVCINVCHAWRSMPFSMQRLRLSGLLLPQWLSRVAQGAKKANYGLMTVTLAALEAVTLIPGPIHFFHFFFFPVFAELPFSFTPTVYVFIPFHGLTIDRFTEQVQMRLGAYTKHWRIQGMRDPTGLGVPLMEYSEIYHSRPENYSPHSIAR